MQGFWVLQLYSFDKARQTFLVGSRDRLSAECTRTRILSLPFALRLVLKVASTADSLAAATRVGLKHLMNGQHVHADWTLLSRGHFPKRANIFLSADIELASSSLQLLLDASALHLVHLAVLVLAFLVAVPNALAPVALFEGIAFRTARRAHLRRGLGCRGGFRIVIVPFHRFAERQ